MKSYRNKQFQPGDLITVDSYPFGFNDVPFLILGTLMRVNNLVETEYKVYNLLEKRIGIIKHEDLFSGNSTIRLNRIIPAKKGKS